MKLYRTNSVLALTTWDEKGKAFIEITPGLDGASKGQPKPGEKRFDYSKTLRISFQVADMLIASYKFIGMSHGVKLDFKKFADMAKVENSANNDKKSLNVALLDKGGVAIGLIQGDSKCSITVSQEEAYAIGKWFEFQAQRFILSGAAAKEAESTQD